MATIQRIAAQKTQYRTYQVAGQTPVVTGRNIQHQLLHDSVQLGVTSCTCQAKPQKRAAHRKFMDKSSCSTVHCCIVAPAGTIRHSTDHLVVSSQPQYLLHTVHSTATACGSVCPQSPHN